MTNRPETARVKLREAFALHQQGRLAEAERLYADIVAQVPDDFDALHLLGIVALQSGRSARAAEIIGKAIALDATVAGAHSNLANALMDLGRAGEALAAYDRALALEPQNAEVHASRATALRALKRFDEALRSCDHAVALKPDYAMAHANRGNVLIDIVRAAEALAAYDAAIRFAPAFAMAHTNRGNALRALKRLDEALLSHDAALKLAPDSAEAHSNRAIVLRELKRLPEAVAAYDRAIALKPHLAETHSNRALALVEWQKPEEALLSAEEAIRLKADFAEAYNNRGLALAGLHRPEEALASYDKALALKSHFAEAHGNRGNLLKDLRRLEDAVASYDKAVAAKPQLGEAHANRGDALRELKRFDEAVASYDKALGLEPDLAGAEGGRLHAKMLGCDWRDFEAECARLAAGVRAGKPLSPPFAFLGLPATAEDHAACASAWVALKHPSTDKPLWRGERYAHERLRVAYLSADFRSHPVGRMIAGVLEHHDRTKFDITGVSFGPDDGSALRARLQTACDAFYDVRDRSDRAVAELLRGLETDIAVDLTGHTQDGRIGILAHRPAPAQANYLGYPGTLGAPFVDYILADRFVAPLEQQRFYAEKIVHLPDCYQANDSARDALGSPPSRRAAGLPEQGFVFCCFNNNYKITPPIYDVWMRLLAKVEGSVLWLLEDGAGAAANLRKEARARGVDPERVLFAGRAPQAEHMARHALADLFLDTLFYNAHTTASDALWAGLPLVTIRGKTFPGRVAASILNAIGLPELVAGTVEDYEAMALALALDPSRLAGVKQKLARHRLTEPLFDTARFTQALEAAYAAMAKG